MTREYRDRVSPPIPRTRDSACSMNSENSQSPPRGDSLDAMNDVFTTEQFRTAVGMGSRGVPLGLRKAEQQQRVVNVKPGVWAKTQPGPFGNPVFERYVDLRALYDERPVRLSHRTAIQSLPVKVEGIRCVNTPFPVSTGERLRLWGVEQHKEPETTFWKFAEHLTHNIWRSAKPRALLECAMFPKRVYEPLLVMAYGMDMLCRPEDLTEVATELGWETGLQRLQSVATEIRNHWQYETLNLHLERFCRMLPEQPKKWTHLKGPPSSPYGQIEYADYENRVWWPILPDVLIESFLW